MDPLLVKTQFPHFCGLPKKIKMLPSLVSLKTKCKTQLFDMAFLKSVANGCSPEAHLHLSQSPLFINSRRLGSRLPFPNFIQAYPLIHLDMQSLQQRQKKLPRYAERKS